MRLLMLLTLFFTFGSLSKAIPLRRRRSAGEANEEEQEVATTLDLRGGEGKEREEENMKVSLETSTVDLLSTDTPISSPRSPPTNKNSTSSVESTTLNSSLSSPSSSSISTSVQDKKSTTLFEESSTVVDMSTEKEDDKGVADQPLPVVPPKESTDRNVAGSDEKVTEVEEINNIEDVFEDEEEEGSGRNYEDEDYSEDKSFHSSAISKFLDANSDMEEPAVDDVLKRKKSAMTGDREKSSGSVRDVTTLFMSILALLI